MSFSIKILGTGSASPLKGRHHSAQLVTVNQASYLLDCGEGTQYRLVDEHANLNKIKAIFISHLHGDHYLGLVGLVSTMALLGRKALLKVYAPIGLLEIVTTQFYFSKTVLEFGLQIVELKTEEIAIIYDDENVTVKSFSLIHGVTSYGFRLEEKQGQRKLRKEKIDGLLVEEMVALKNSKNVLDENGDLKYTFEEYTVPPTKCGSYAYCSDTIFVDKTIEYVSGVDLLYHETTYLEEHKEKAVRNFHATAKEAGIIARNAKVGRLLIGHLSSRYEDFEAHLIEARKEFYETIAATEGKTFVL